MGDMMTFPNTVEEFMEQYKIVDDEKVYTNGADLVPIFRMMQWFEHISATDINVGTTDARQDFMDIVYEELEDDPDNNRANRIIWAADGYAERRVDDALQVIEELQSAKLGTNLAEVGTDCISRQAAIDALGDYMIGKRCPEDGTLTARLIENEVINKLPPAQPEQHLDEWCTDCKEYDHENSCCPRWTKVIRQTRRELQDEFVMTAVDGTLWVTVDDVQKVGRVIVDEEKSKFCRQFYMDAQPKQRTGKWIPQDHNKRAGNISTCVYYYPICSNCGKVGIETYKYCPHCGAKMISEGKTCDCYRDGTCIGTKEIDSCSCGGVKSKCDFYEHVRWEGDAE